MKRVGALLLGTALVACTSAKSANSTGAPPPALSVSAVAWNPSNVDVGTVQAIAEEDHSLLVLGSKGALTFSSGAIIASDDTITSWRSAAVVPAANGLTTWRIGIDGAGHVQRLGSNGAPEDVSDRYGLTTDDVQDVVSGALAVGFLLANGAAVTDGANILHYQVPAHAITANGTAFALADGAAVRVFDQGKELDVPLPDARRIAYDAAGTLFAATTHALYRIDGTVAKPLFDGGSRTIYHLAHAGPNVWLQVDGDLALLQDGHVAIASGTSLPPDARLVGSSTGDVWVLAGGQLFQWTAQPGGGSDEATWSATVEPIYATVCSNCHSPAGSGKSSSNVDLSNYSAWSALKPAIYARVVLDADTPKSMPPTGYGFSITAAQKSAIAAWSKP